MDGLIQMLPPSFRKFSTYIDFVGQRRAERIFQVVCSLIILFNGKIFTVSHVGENSRKFQSILFVRIFR